VKKGQENSVTKGTAKKEGRAGEKKRVILQNLGRGERMDHRSEGLPELYRTNRDIAYI